MRQLAAIPETVVETIVAFVTIGTMVVLHFSVLKPILILRDSMIRAGAKPAIADRFAIHSRRADEMGETISAHNAMLHQIAASKRRDREVAEERTRYVTHHDTVTGLPNRTALLDYLEHQSRIKDKRPCSTSLYLIKLGGFQQINASYGVITGDALLRTFSARLKNCIGPESFLAHVGSDLDRFGRSPRLAINLSARQFADPGLLQQIRNALEKSGIPPDLLELEITETAVMQDVDQTSYLLNTLRAMGLRISIDDFGTGYSSLTYLRRFQVDAIKIDKSFVDDIGKNHNTEVICKAILRLGQTLGTKVIAEGVENAEQLAFLRRCKCDEAQGYLFSKPLPAGDFETIYLAGPGPAYAGVSTT